MLATAALLTATPCQDQEQREKLQPGGKPPAFALSQMVRGEAVVQLQPGVVHLIEFWADDAGAGFDRYEEFAKLQKQHGEHLVITGVVGPNEEDYDFETVRDYYAKHGKHIDFRIGFDADGKLHERWLTAVDTEAPHVFLVDAKGKLAWSGGLGYLPLALPRVLKGDVDYRQLAEDQAAAEKKLLRLALVCGFKPKIAIKELDEFVESWPALAYLGTVTTWSGLLDSDEPKLALPLAKRMCEVCCEEGDAMLLNGMSWTLVDPENEWQDRQLGVAETAAKKAVELTQGEDGAVLDTLARVYFWKKDYKAAVATQQKAMDKALDDGERRAYEVILEQYRKLVDGK